MSTQRRLEPHPFVPYVDAGHICKHCDGGEYAACHEAKELTMSDTLQEQEDGISTATQDSDDGPLFLCSDPACPCHVWAKQRSATTHHCTVCLRPFPTLSEYMKHKCKPASKPEPAASNIGNLLDQLRDQLSGVIITAVNERERLMEIAKDALRFREEVNGKCGHEEAMTKLCTQCEIRAVLDEQKGQS